MDPNQVTVQIGHAGSRFARDLGMSIVAQSRD